MQFKELLEARSSTVRKYENLSFIEFASEFPSELARYILYRIKNEGYELFDIEEEDFINSFKKDTSDLDKNKWFDKSSIEINFKEKSFSRSRNKLRLVLKLLKTTLQYEIHIFYSMSIEKNINTLKSTKEIFDTILKNIKYYKKELSADQYKDIDKAYEKYKDLLDKETANWVKKLKRRAKKYNLHIYNKIENEGNQIIITPGEMWGLGGKYNKSDIGDKINSNLINKLFSFTFSFRYQQLLKFLPTLYKELENNNFTIIKGPSIISDYSFLYIYSINKEKYLPSRSKDNDNKLTYKEAEKIRKENFKNILEEKIEKSFGTESEVQQLFIKNILKEENE